MLWQKADGGEVYIPTEGFRYYLLIDKKPTHFVCWLLFYLKEIKVVDKQTSQVYSECIQTEEISYEI